MFPVQVIVILALSLAAFTYTAYRRGFLLLKFKKADRLDQTGKRILGVIEYAIGQKRVLFRDFKSGIFHAFIFWGFCILALRTIFLFGIGIHGDFVLPGFGGVLGDFYNFVKDIFEALVVIGVVALLFRRIFLRPKRLTLSVEANIILLTILFLMLTDFLIDGSNIILHGIPAGDEIYAPIGYPTAKLLITTGFSIPVIEYIFTVSFFSHLIAILAFLNYLPYGKHFHIITSLPNVFFRNLKPYGALTPMNLEDENATTFGIDKIEQFSWKDALDMYTCTECGRCQDQCPAYACDKPLSPKEFNIGLRNHLYKMSSGLLKTGKNGNVPPAENGRPALIGDIIKKEAIWSCTTCRACEEACPLMIEYVQKMIDLRRHMVLMQGDLTPEAQTALQNIENNSNPWGIGFSERGAWARDLGIKTMAEDNNVEYLYFVGCAGSFDDRAKKVSRAFAILLKKAGVSFAILGDEELCTGDSARRLGNEYLFQTLVKKNIETFNKYKVKRVVTTCPHCYNTIKNEFPQFGGSYEVSHHTELLTDLIKSGRLLNSDKTMSKTKLAVFHDSCYLGRYNDIYEPPRYALHSCGLSLAESENSKDKGRCCGAGGGWMWMEDKLGTRINHKRLEDMEKTGASTIATACPFCLTMLSDATKEKNMGDKLEVKDVAEILSETLIM